MEMVQRLTDLVVPMILSAQVMRLKLNLKNMIITLTMHLPHEHVFLTCLSVIGIVMMTNGDGPNSKMTTRPSTDPFQEIGIRHFSGLMAGC